MDLTNYFERRRHVLGAGQTSSTLLSLDDVVISWETTRKRFFRYLLKGGSKRPRNARKDEWIEVLEIKKWSISSHPIGRGGRVRLTTGADRSARRRTPPTGSTPSFAH